MDERQLISECAEAAIAGRPAGAAEAAALIGVPDALLPELAAAADRITKSCAGGIDVEQLYNIRRNGCSEDCSFCGQSAFYEPGRQEYELPPVKDVLQKARAAKEQGSESYCLVAAWRQPPPGGLESVCEMVREIRRDIGIAVECSLGFVDSGQAAALREAGVRRYNHNLETARSMFPSICTTHTYDDRLQTLHEARKAGLELCTGGIIGMGETRAQRLELALELGRLRPEEATINILVPVAGTPLELQAPLQAGEAARMFAALRFLLPASIIKISGGRETALADHGAALLRGGANGIITAGYLTMGGNDPGQDAALIREIGA